MLVFCKNYEKCGNEVERANLTQEPSCFDCKVARQKARTARVREEKIKTARLEGHQPCREDEHDWRLGKGKSFYYCYKRHCYEQKYVS